MRRCPIHPLGCSKHLNPRPPRPPLYRNGGYPLRGSIARYRAVPRLDAPTRGNWYRRYRLERIPA